MPILVQPFKDSVFAAIGKSATFSFRFTGSFGNIEFGPWDGSAINPRAIIVSRASKDAPVTILDHPNYKGRISWAGQVSDSPVKAVFILSNVSKADSGSYGYIIDDGGLSIGRTIELTVTGKKHCYMVPKCVNNRFF